MVAVHGHLHLQSPFTNDFKLFQMQFFRHIPIISSSKNMGTDIYHF